MPVAVSELDCLQVIVDLFALCIGVLLSPSAIRLRSYAGGRNAVHDGTQASQRLDGMPACSSSEFDVAVALI